MTRRPPAWSLLCVPVVVGAFVMWLGGAPIARWSGHLVAGGAGVLAYAAALRAPHASFRTPVATAIAATIATLASPGLQDVHRWLALGSLRLHASALVMPALLVCVAGSPPPRQLLLLVMQAVHLAQPDAGQATAVAAASVVIAARGPERTIPRVCAALSVAAAVATWLRADPLPPAPFVEDIVGRAFGIAPWVGCLALASVAAPLAAFRVERGDDVSPTTKAAAGALTAYFTATLLVTIVGRFPVPLLGFGISPIVGAFLGLAALRRLSPGTTPPRAATLPGGK